LLGAAAGDMALMVKVRRVYLVGGIVQSALPVLKSGGFRRRFDARGRYGNVLDRVPTIAALGTDVGLIGAAAIAGQ
jgi:glucokinase